MTRRGAVIACLLAWVGKPILAEVPKSKPTANQEKPSSQMTGTGTTKPNWVVSTPRPINLQIMLGKGQFEKLVVKKDDKEITLTADEIWEAFQPPTLESVKYWPITTKPVGLGGSCFDHPADCITTQK